MAKKYDPHKCLPANIVNRALVVVNKIRKLHKVPLLTKLPPGVANHPCKCPIGVALTPVAKKLGGKVVIVGSITFEVPCIQTNPFTGKKTCDAHHFDHYNRAIETFAYRFDDAIYVINNT